MAVLSTPEETFALVRQLSAAHKTQRIERIAPELECESAQLPSSRKVLRGLWQDVDIT